MLPTLLVVYSILFILKQLAPGDPVAIYRHQEAIFATKGTLQDKLAADFQYNSTAQLLGTDLPLFYFSILPSNYPDTLYRIIRKDQREMLTCFLDKNGNWKFVNEYFKDLQISENKYFDLNDSLKNKYKSSYWAVLQKLFIETDSIKQVNLLASLENQAQNNAILHEMSQTLIADYQNIKNNSVGNYWMPKFIWHGFNNQFQFGLNKVFSWDFGNSFVDNRPVNQKLMDHLKWTLFMNFIAIFIVFGISLPLGVYLSEKENTWIEKSISSFAFGIYALPVFWVATLLIHVFATDSYHMNFFPASGIGDPFVKGWSAILDTLWHLVLPIFCLIYHDIAYLSLQMKGSMLEVFQQDYIKLAIAKGLPKKHVVWNHAFKNAFLPIATHISAIFPAMITGSIIVENIFGIPGMGDLAVKSILSQDWPVVSSIVFITATLTMIGMLLTDLVISRLNPRIRFS